MRRTAVNLLCIDLERSDSREALRQALGERAYQRACQAATGRFLAIWLGVRGCAYIPLAEEADLLKLELLAIDLADGLGLIELQPLELAPETMEAMRREFDRHLPPSTSTPQAPRLRLVAVADNTAVLARAEVAPDTAPARVRVPGES